MLSSPRTGTSRAWGCGLMKMRQPDKEITDSSSPSTTSAVFPVNKPKADMSGIHLLAIRTKVRRRDSILMPLELLEELRILLHAFCKVETGSDLCQPSFGCLTPQQLALSSVLHGYYPFSWLKTDTMTRKTEHCIGSTYYVGCIFTSC